MLSHRRSKTVLVVGFVLSLLAAASCQRGPQLTASQRRGKQIYDAFCDKCHKPIDPKTLSVDRLNAAADKYGVKLNLRQDEISFVKDYLTRAHDSL